MALIRKYGGSKYRTRSRRGWTKQEASYVWERDGGMCIYCGAPGYEIDHVVPVAKGGPTKRDNAVLACRGCNHHKSAKFPIDMLIRAFYHLLTKGEDISWLDDLWTVQSDAPRVIREGVTTYSVDTEDPQGLRFRILGFLARHAENTIVTGTVDRLCREG